MTSSGLSQAWRQNAREMRAKRYEEIAQAIDEGRLEIKGALPEVVTARLRDKAQRVREGEHVPKDRKKGSFQRAD